MATSNTYNFGDNAKVDELSLEAFERIGIIGNDITGLQTASAIRSMNLELTQWSGRGLNLWLVQREMFALYPNQAIYMLPKYTVRVLEVVAVTPTRLNVGGTAISGGNVISGSPSNCFTDGNTNGCIIDAGGLDTPWIGYDYGQMPPPSIFYVGITSNIALQSWTITVEYSYDSIIWTPLYTAPQQPYPKTQIVWLVLENALNARYWRIREATGQPLILSQVYFTQPTQSGYGDRGLAPLSREEYMLIANKQTTTSFPSGYYFNEKIQPSMCMWPVPNGNYTAILYANYRYPQDIVDLVSNAEIPQSFVDALISGTSARLAAKFAPQFLQQRQMEAQMSYDVAANTNFEDVPLRITPDLGAYS